jgi:hypothetical protein
MRIVGQLLLTAGWSAYQSLWLLLVAWVALIVVDLRDANAEGRKLAILIGAGDYKDADLQLTNTKKDLEELETALTERGDYIKGDVRIFLNASRETLQLEVPEFLAGRDGPNENDQLLVYFTGH